MTLKTSSINQRSKQRLDVFHKMTLDGKFGTEIQEMAIKGSHTSVNDLLIQSVNNIYTVDSIDDIELVQIMHYGCQILIATYCLAKKKDPTVANSLLFSFTEDYPGVPDSNLLSRWLAFTEASLGFKSTPKTNYAPVWTSLLHLNQVCNEFFNGLLGYYILMWRCHLGKSINPNVLHNAYGAKFNELFELSDGEDGIFYMYFRLAVPKIRNAIAHSSIYLNSESNEVIYFDGKNLKTEYKIPLIEFAAITAASTRLSQGYYAALASLLILEHGSLEQKLQLPSSLVNIYTKNS